MEGPLRFARGPMGAFGPQRRCPRSDAPFGLGRAASFLRATADYPLAFSEELRVMSEAVLRGAPGDAKALTIVHLNAAGNSIRPWLPAEHQLFEFEMDQEFADASGMPMIDDVGALPLQDGSADRILVLAVLHHFSAEQRRRLYADCKRVLRPGRGRMVIADVIAESAQAAWLNGFVDRHSSTGHRGEFFTAAEADVMLDAGFSEVTVARSSHAWRFGDREERRAFMAGIFGLSNDAPLEDALTATFGPQPSHDVPWQLVIFHALAVA
jgi:SAM-dependent methyltransferase